VAVGRVVIVGAGPAGAALAYLLARRGVEVALLERHPDFECIFRGDGLQPSGIGAFDQMGLGDRLRQLPRAIINAIDLYHDVYAYWGVTHCRERGRRSAHYQ
jgi:2-polyprenyl-6-methoxyphenol hydroxylase-like FAD-dependent oxidoreductase